MVGVPAVGKTSLVRRFVYSRFDERYLSTIGTSISRREVELDFGGNAYFVKMILWDLAGAEHFSALMESYFRGLSGAMLVCDLTRENTLESLRSHVQTIQKINRNASIVLLCNKADLESEREISDNKIKEISETLGIDYFLTSAKSGHNVEAAFSKLAQHIVHSAS